MGQRARHSTKRSGCDCLNKTPALSDRPNGGQCEYCAETTIPGTGTISFPRNAPCYFVALFGCDHYTNDAEREHIATPCVVLRKDCVAGDRSCIWSSRWQCATADPNLDQPVLTTDQCFAGGGSTTGYAEFQPCRDVKRCGGLMFVRQDPPEEGGGDRCSFSQQFRVLCCEYYWIFDDVLIRELCPEFADDWAGVDSRDRGQFARCCICEDAETFASPGISGEACEPSSVICPHGRTGGTPDWDCCSVDTLLDVAPAPLDPSTYVLDCIFCKLDMPDPPTDEDYVAYRADPTIFCSGKILYNNSLVTACTWAEQPCEGIDGCDSPGTEFGEGTGTDGDEIDRLACFTKWELIPTSTTTALFRGRSRRGYFANYVCNDWNCYRRCTFTMQKGDYSAEVVGLPLCLCIVPHNYIEPQCGQSGQLACCDTGGDSLAAKMTVRDCNNNLIIDNEWVSFARGGVLPCGVSNPFPNDPCLYFTATVSVDEGCDQWGGDLFIVMYCSENTYAGTGGSNPCGDSPTQYNFVVYCFNADEGCWEEKLGICSSYTCECFGPNPPELSLTKPCCCEPCCPCAADDNMLLDVVVTCQGQVTSLQTINTSGTEGACEFNIEGGEECTIQGTLICTPGNGPTLEMAASCADPVAACTWDPTGENAAEVVVNSCDPLDITITNPNGDVVQITQVG